MYPYSDEDDDYTRTTADTTENSTDNPGRRRGLFAAISFMQASVSELEKELWRIWNEIKRSLLLDGKVTAEKWVKGRPVSQRKYGWVDCRYQNPAQVPRLQCRKTLPSSRIIGTKRKKNRTCKK